MVVVGGGRFVRSTNAHLSDGGAVAKMGHPGLCWMGHPEFTGGVRPLGFGGFG